MSEPTSSDLPTTSAPPIPGELTEADTDRVTQLFELVAELGLEKPEEILKPENLARLVELKMKRLVMELDDPTYQVQMIRAVDQKMTDYFTEVDSHRPELEQLLTPLISRHRELSSMIKIRDQLKPSMPPEEFEAYAADVQGDLDLFHADFDAAIDRLEASKYTIDATAPAAGGLVDSDFRLERLEQPFDLNQLFEMDEADTKEYQTVQQMVQTAPLAHLVERLKADSPLMRELKEFAVENEMFGDAEKMTTELSELVGVTFNPAPEPEKVPEPSKGPSEPSAEDLALIQMLMAQDEGMLAPPAAAADHDSDDDEEDDLIDDDDDW